MPLWTSKASTLPPVRTTGPFPTGLAILSSVQFNRSVVANSLQSHGLQYATLPCHHQLPELAQTHVHRVSDVIQPSHPVIPLSSCLQSLLASASFPMSQFFTSGVQIIGASASASVLPTTIQDWFPLGWTGWISLQSKGLSRVLQHHSSKAPILQCSTFFIVLLSHPHMTTGKTIGLTRKTFVGKVMSLFFNMLSRLVITFLPRSKGLLISWLWSPPAVTGVQENKVCHCFHCFPIYLPWSDGTRCHDLSFLNVEF